MSFCCFANLFLFITLIKGLKSFCIGKASGTYTNPFDSKSFLTCANGVMEERECPEATLFNPKEKICDVPNDIQTQQMKTG